MTLAALWCFIVCFGSDDYSQATTLGGDFCTSYKRLILTPSDALTVKVLPRTLKERLAFNELLHRCMCDPPRANDPRCSDIPRRDGVK
jgi:hypothetical protein